MLTAEDLLAAKILASKRPELKDVLFNGVSAIMEGGVEKGLLASLVTFMAITHDEALWVHEHVEHYKRTWALAIYKQLLLAHGVDEERIEEAMESLGPQAKANLLGGVLVGADHMSAELHKALSYQARQAFDQHLAERVSDYLEERAKLEDPTESAEERGDRPGGWTQTLPTVSSDIYKLDLTSVPEAPPSELGRVEEPPKFSVPDWVDTAEPRAGEHLAGYRILGRAGRGAMGVVYLADHPDDPTRPVALKVLLEDASDEARGRFKREILANSMIAHEGILEVYDAGETDDGVPYLAMEFFDGADLAQILRSEERLDLAQALSLGIQLSAALGATHEAGVVHRDIKPENVLVSHDGRDAKLMDYGIAILPGLEGVEEVEVFQTMSIGDDPSLVAGTPRYMSPEQASYTQGGVGPASDLYSLGLVIFEMLSGRLPYESDSAHGFMTAHVLHKPRPLAEADPMLAALPQDLQLLLACLLAKAPERRPSPSDVVLTLERILGQVLDGEVEMEAPAGEPDEEQDAPEPEPDGPKGRLIDKRKSDWNWGAYGKRRG